jgi:hypothetical protein
MLSSQIEKMISYENLRKNIEIESLKLATDIFNLEIINEQLEKIYANICKKISSIHLLI